MEEIRNVKIRFGAEKYYGAIITIKPEEIIKGTLDETQIKILWIVILARLIRAEILKS